MAPDGPPDAEKRETLRRFAAVGAVGPFAAASRVADTEPDSVRRKAVLGYVERSPGVHFSKLRDDLNLGTGETQYHLRRLERAGTIESHEDGEYRRLFLGSAFDDTERTILSALRRQTHGGILVEALRSSEIAAGELADRLDVSTPAVSRAAGQLEDAGLLTRDRGTYRLTTPETVSALLERFADSFDDRTATIARTAPDRSR